MRVTCLAECLPEADRILCHNLRFVHCAVPGRRNTAYTFPQSHRLSVCSAFTQGEQKLTRKPAECFSSCDIFKSDSLCFWPVRLGVGCGGRAGAPGPGPGRPPATPRPPGPGANERRAGWLTSQSDPGSHPVLSLQLASDPPLPAQPHWVAGLAGWLEGSHPIPTLTTSH